METNDRKSSRTVSWDELQQSLQEASLHPENTAWDIYHYVKDNIDTLSSQEARYLLAIYMKMHIPCPSLIHSCMLGIALKVAAKHADFRLPDFLRLWGFPANFRKEDLEDAVGHDGRKFLSLKERTERAVKSYFLHHANEREEAGGEYVENIVPMVAIKVFETEKNGRRMRSVKLVGADGLEILADSHTFPCRPWEIEGRLFDVMLRKSKEGVLRAGEIVQSSRRINDVFPSCVGYVEYVDTAHNHIHIYDQYSRHLVANGERTRVKEGDFVSFCPIIPKEDKFKCAAVTSVFQQSDGRNAFGFREATVTFVDGEKGYCAWKLNEGQPKIVESGTESPSFDSGFLHGEQLPSLGQKIRLIVFLKRMKDKLKRPYVIYYE